MSARDPRVSIRPYRDGDEAAIRRGFEQVFGHPRSGEEHAWKLPPEQRAETVMIAEREGEVLAHFAALPVRLQVDGRTVRAAQAVDVYSTRRPGIFLRLVDRFYDELCGPGRLEVLYGFPGERHFRLGVRKLRYSEPLPVAYWTRRLGPARARRTRVPGRWGDRLRGGIRGAIGGVSVQRGFDPAAIDDLWRRSTPRYPVAAVRDHEWLGRRFTGRPGVEYLHLTVRHRGRRSGGASSCAALAVVRLADGVLHWAELVWDGRHPATLAALDDEVTAVAREAGVSELRLWLGHDPAASRVLERRGWRRAREPQDLHLGAVSFLPDLDAAELCRHLYLTMGDADLV